MPKYSYRCTACSNAFDIQQSFTDESLTVCPECGGALRKIFGAVGISFKGSGFYANDHGSRSASKASAASDGSAASSDAAASSSPAKSGDSSGANATASSPPASAPATSSASAAPAGAAT